MGLRVPFGTATVSVALKVNKTINRDTHGVLIHKKAVARVACLTPFDSHGRLDEEGFRQHLKRMASAGIGVDVAGGGSGEAFTFSPEENERVLAIAVEELSGHGPVVALGVEPRTAKQMIEFIQVSEACGVDLVQIYPLDAGHGTKPSDRELETYFNACLEATHKQAIISTQHSVGYLIPTDMLERLIARFANVAYVYCTTPDIGYLARVIDVVGPDVGVVSGGPQHALTNLALGGCGFACSEANVAPRLAQLVADAYNQRDVDTTEKAFGRLVRLYAINQRFGAIRGVKAMLELLGLPGGQPRPPRLPVPAEMRVGLLGELESLRIQETELGAPRQRLER